MLKIFVNDCDVCVYLTKYPSNYSIIKGNVEDIMLNNGWNEFSNLNYGFHLESINNSAYITQIDLSNFTVDNVNHMTNMFRECKNLKYIKCKRSFKEWCIKNQDEIGLPDSMREGGDGVWDIID